LTSQSEITNEGPLHDQCGVRQVCLNQRQNKRNLENTSKRLASKENSSSGREPHQKQKVVFIEFWQEGTRGRIGKGKKARARQWNGKLFRSRSGTSRAQKDLYA